MIYLCGQSNRRELVLAAPGLNGIDYLEVTGPPGCGTELAITFLKDARGLTLTQANVIITGDAPVSVKSLTPATAQDPYLLTVQLEKTGDFAPYTLRLAATQTAADGTVTVTPDPPDGLDPLLSAVTFSFKAGCPSPADCLQACAPQPLPPAPDINYLARDYDGFRQVMLDRLAVLIPAWTERHAADLGIALVEALAYAADHLSYQQDAVGTEAYLGTARSRISLRRHARLVSYHVGEGCNARALIAVNTTQDATLPAGTLCYPVVPGLPVAGGAAGPLAAQLSGTSPVFASLQSAPLATEQNEMHFYTWGDENCCLPAGAAAATLTAPDPQQGNLTSLAPGIILVFEEVLGPGTGTRADADPAHRCAVRLTSARWTDYKGAPLTDPVTGTRITEVSWAQEDALPFSLCLSATVNDSPVGDVSVARGNIVLADEGAWAGVPPREEALPVVPASGRYYPRLAQSPMTFAVPFTAPVSAAAFLTQDPGEAVPVIALTDSENRPWTPRPDLLSSEPGDAHFVVEVERDGTAFLRFGDGAHGALPDPNLGFKATYRVGNGTAGNVGRDALGHAVVPVVTPPFPVTAITGIRNPLPVTGGVDMESAEHIRQFVPFAFQTQQRCVTEDDYGQQAALLPGVAAARGTLRWTGSWYTAFVSVEPTPPASGGAGSAPPLPGQLAAAVAGKMSRLRMLGTDVAVEAAIIVGLRIELTVCVADGHFRGDVYTALVNRFTGAGGLLNAANFTFGQTVYASPLIAAAQAVEGVSAVTLAVFSRLDKPWVDGVADGFLTMARLEIPRCDNDPDHLDHGTFTLAMDGGK
jgi:hypothetical protein